MEELEYLISKKKLKDKYYIKFKQKFLKTNNMKETIKKHYKIICFSSIRANLCLEFLQYCIEKLKKEKNIYENLSFQQKREFNYIYDSLYNIHYNSTKNIEYMAEIIK